MIPSVGPWRLPGTAKIDEVDRVNSPRRENLAYQGRRWTTLDAEVGKDGIAAERTQ